jgi:hypothetical protein
VSGEIREWNKVVHSPNGTTVTTSLVQGNRSARWTSKTYGSIEQGLLFSRANAYRALGELTAALTKIEAES